MEYAFQDLMLYPNPVVSMSWIILVEPTNDYRIYILYNI